MKKYLFIFCVALLGGCAEFQNLSKAATAIAEYAGTSDVTVGTSNFASTNKGSKESFKIVMKNVPQIDKNSYNPELLASYSAKILYDNLSDEERAEREVIDVQIVSQSRTVEYRYKQEDLKAVEKYAEVSKAFFSNLKTKQYDKMYDDFVDTTAFPKQAFVTDFVGALVAKNESVFADIVALEFTGFHVGEFKGKSLFEVVIFGKLKNGQHLTMLARFLKGSDKVVGLKID
ncbi:hypothetical protein [Flavobacterium sp.]|uniref:hypothetical protein n=1 Tax=Flavobacterium sp. TaxID=239 RepID=UPI0039E4A241